MRNKYIDDKCLKFGVLLNSALKKVISKIMMNNWDSEKENDFHLQNEIEQALFA